MNNHSFDAIVPPKWHGYRLDKVLAHVFPQYSRTYLQQQITSARVFIDSNPVKKINLRALANQRIQLYPSIESLEMTWCADASVKLSIVYEDEALLVVNKPSNLVTHPALGHLQHTLANGLLHYLPALAQLPRAGIIHRLDKDTSGLLVIPKTLEVHTYLVRELAARHIQRTYRAVVRGELTTSGTINLPIGRHPTVRQKQAVTLQGKPAVTHYRIVEHLRHHTVLEIQLETGRTHQIRVHMAHLKHPIAGDKVYSRCTTPRDIPCQRQALHAYQLSFIHPLTHQPFYCKAPLPEDMENLITALRH